jgi:hypothetical protein
MTDVTLTARFLALSRLKRAQGTTAKLWISQVLTRKALLEDPKLLAPILLPECLYLEILVGQMSAQETTVFNHCPSIGDDLLQKTVMGQKKFTLDKLKRSIDACSNPPYFRGVSTPITDLLDATEPKVAKQKRDQTKDQTGKTKKMASLTQNPRMQGKPTPKILISLAVPHTNNPPNYLRALSVQTSKLWLMATKLPPNRSVSSMTI